MSCCNEKFSKGKHKHDTTGGITFGGMMVIAGAAFLASHLGYLGDLPVWKLWPVLLAWIGLVKLFTRSFLGGFLHIGIGAVVMAHYLGYLGLEWNVIWPILLIIAGLSIFAGSLFVKKNKPVTGDSTASFFNSSVVLSGKEEAVHSQEFEGGNVSCVMGGLELDMRGAQMKADEAVLRVRLVMGGMELRIPENWSVVAKGTPILGGFENKTRPIPEGDEPAKRLIIDGSIIMGGIEIRN